MFGNKSLAYNRFGLGARPGDSIGGDVQGWLLDQLARFEVRPGPLANQPTRHELANLFREYRDGAAARRDRTPESDMESMRGDTDKSENRRTDGNRTNTLQDAYVSACQARLSTALVSDTPFVDRLVHFWSNHFAISIDKQPVVPLAGNYEFEAIRPNIMGNFGDLLKAAVLHPAMLLYLDQVQSMGPASELAERVRRRARNRQQGREFGLNENLAREILELHTLGVRTGYSQADVTELARALTGWSVAGLQGGRLQKLLHDSEPGETVFAATIHEPGARDVLGQRYGEDGSQQSLAILHDLATSPETARHIATKLARHFAADDPPPVMVARLEKAFLESGGDLPSVYRALIASPEAWDGRTTKFRNPWDWAVAALRAGGIDNLPGRRGPTTLFQQLGQPIWRPGSPAGWGDTTPDWAGPGALMTRVEVAQQFASRLGNNLDPRQLAQQLMPDGISVATSQAIARSEQVSTGLALLFASPEFLRR